MCRRQSVPVCTGDSAANKGGVRPSAPHANVQGVPRIKSTEILASPLQWDARLVAGFSVAHAAKAVSV